MLTVGCERDPCVEDIRAQVLPAAAAVVVGDGQDSAPFVAEWADADVERERGWQHRRCDRDAIVLQPTPAPAPMLIYGCNLTAAIDAVFVRDGRAVRWVELAPCGEPCGACPLEGALGPGAAGAAPVDAVIEWPLGAVPRALQAPGIAVRVEPPGRASATPDTD
jgi:uncharacterized membrane protein (UPF0127 family)